MNRSACNGDFTIITIVRDTDQNKTRKIRKYLCDYHTAKLENYIARGMRRILLPEECDMNFMFFGDYPPPNGTPRDYFLLLVIGVIFCVGLLVLYVKKVEEGMRI